MKISVIVPVYKVEKYLGECINSILNQTFTDFELILVDDGSPDNSGKICDEYAKKDERVKVIHKKNGGVSVARNTGLDCATGEFITFIDSDDYVDKDFFDYAIKSISDDKYDMFISGLVMETYDSNEKMTDVITYRITENSCLTVKQLFESLTVKYPLICICGPWCKLFKRDIIEQYKVRFSPKLERGEDTLFNMTYLQHTGKIFFSEKTYYHYRRGNLDSLFSKFNKDTYEIRRLVYGEMRNLMAETKCNQDSLVRVNNMYCSFILGCIHEYFRFFDKSTKAEKILLLKKIANDDIAKKTKLSTVKSPQNALILALIRIRMYELIYLIFRMYYCFKKYDSRRLIQNSDIKNN